uniref:Ovule protein n=1 Tax=Ascaris lumbricoides TaxID=6252 RepID=A0A0M3IGP0_ASCLU
MPYLVYIKSSEFLDKISDRFILCHMSVAQFPIYDFSVSVIVREIYDASLWILRIVLFDTIVSFIPECCNSFLVQWRTVACILNDRRRLNCMCCVLQFCNRDDVCQFRLLYEMLFVLKQLSDIFEVAIFCRCLSYSLLLHIYAVVFLSGK